MRKVLIRFTEKSQIEENYEVTDEEYDRLMKGEWVGDVIEDDGFWDDVEHDLDKFGYCGIIPEVINRYEGDSLAKLISAIKDFIKVLANDKYIGEILMQKEEVEKGIDNIFACLNNLKAYTNEFLVLSNR